MRFTARSISGPPGYPGLPVKPCPLGNRMRTAARAALRGRPGAKVPGPPNVTARQSRKGHRIERFADYTRGAQRHRSLELALARGHENDGNVGGSRILLQMSKRHQAVHEWHDDIKEDEVGPIFRSGRKPLFARGATAQDKVGI